jgi:dTDP-4-dehydrorhamnose reductase
MQLTRPNMISRTLIKQDNGQIINELSRQLSQSGQWEQYSTSSPHSDISNSKDTSNL